MPQRGRRRAQSAPTRVGDVLAVRPRLHDPRGERRRRAHLEPVPRHAHRRARPVASRRPVRTRRWWNHASSSLPARAAILGRDPSGERVHVGEVRLGAPRGTRRRSVTESVAASSKYARWLTWSAIVQPVGRRGRPPLLVGQRTRAAARSSRVSAARSSSSASMSTGTATCPASAVVVVRRTPADLPARPR